MNYSILLYAAIAVITVDALIEMAFIATTVSWLHTRAGGNFWVNGPNGQFPLHGKPAVLAVNEGHASNGAAGTIYVVIGLGGLLTFWLRNRQLKREGRLSGGVKGLYNFWLGMTIVSAIFSLACWVYVLVKVYDFTGQRIDVGLASRLNNHLYPNYVAYPRNQWTPQNWLPALLQLNLVHKSDYSDIRTQLAVCHGWEWNLLPMWILGFVVVALAFLERKQRVINGSSQTNRGLARHKEEAEPFSP